MGTVSCACLETFRFPFSRISHFTLFSGQQRQPTHTSHTVRTTRSTLRLACPPPYESQQKRAQLSRPPSLTVTLKAPGRSSCLAADLACSCSALSLTQTRNRVTQVTQRVTHVSRACGAGRRGSRGTAGPRRPRGGVRPGACAEGRGPRLRDQGQMCTRRV